MGAYGPLRGNRKLNFSNPHINPSSYTCPAGSNNYDYDIKVSVDDNQSSSNITIKSVATNATATKLVGSWGIAVGARSGAENLTFAPKSIGSGSKVTFNVTTPWSCTNSGTGGVKTYADFALVMTVVTSSGTYKVNLPWHRMNMG